MSCGRTPDCRGRTPQKARRDGTIPIKMLNFATGETRNRKALHIWQRNSRELTRSDDNYSQWYNDLVVKAGLAENSAVRGCMVIKPYGYAIWGEDARRAGRHVQADGPPERLLPRSSSRSRSSRRRPTTSRGFAKECAVVTHYRLKNDPEGARAWWSIPTPGWKRN